jgi:hypothetical protein
VGTDHNLVICRLYCRKGAAVAALRRAEKRAGDQGPGAVQEAPRISDSAKLQQSNLRIVRPNNKIFF